MKKIIFFSALLAAGILRAQTTYDVEWQNVCKSSSSSGKRLGGVALSDDPATGEIFTIGSFCNTIKFSSTISLSSTGGNDVYVAKYNSSGTVLKAVKLGTNYVDDIPYSIAFQGGNVFVSWYDNASTGGGGKITKLNNTTPLGTVSTCSLGSGVYPHSLFAYGTVNVLVGGSFTGEVDLPTGATPIHLVASNFLSCGDCYDSFVASLTASSNLINTAKNPNYSLGSNEIMAISCRNGRIYVTGYFKDSLRLVAGGAKVKALGTQDAFVASVYLNPLIPQTIAFFNDDLVRGGNTATDTDVSKLDCGYGITSNATAIFITGSLNNSPAPTFGSTTYNNGGGAFVARINYNGSNVGTTNWVRATYDCFAGTAIMASIGYGIAADLSGNIFATGQASTATQMTDGSNSICISGSGDPGFISRFSSTGTLISADAINQSATTPSHTEGRAIVTDSCAIYTTGFFSNDVDGVFSAGNFDTVQTSTNTGMYLIDINRDLFYSSNQAYCASCGSFPISCNLYAASGTGYTYSWTGGPPTLTSAGTATPGYLMTSCTSASATVYTLTTTNTVTATCPTTATVTVSTGPAASGQANAGPDVLVCVGHTYVLGTAGQAGLKYSWKNTGYLDNPALAQPTFTTPAGGLPVTYTLTVTDYCGNTSYDYVTVSLNPLCPHRMANPDLNQPALVTGIYPNPSAGVFNLDLIPSATETEVSFEVTDLTGRIVQKNIITTSGGTQTIDLSKEGKGVYLLRVVRDGQTELHRLVVE